MDSERTDWISQYGAGVRKKKTGIFTFIRAALLKRSERRVRDVNDLHAGICIRRYNLAFGIDSDIAGAVNRMKVLPEIRAIEAPKQAENLLQEAADAAVDFNASESGNRTGVDTVFTEVSQMPTTAVATCSGAADAPQMNPFPFETEIENEEIIDDVYMDPYYEDLIRRNTESESNNVQQPAEEPVQEIEQPMEETVDETEGTTYGIESDLMEFFDVMEEERSASEVCTREVNQSSLDDPLFHSEEASVSAEPVIVRQDTFDIEYEDMPSEDIEAAEPESFDYAETEAEETVQPMESSDYTAIEEPADMPALGAPLSEPVLMLTGSAPVEAVCAPPETLCIEGPAEAPVEIEEEPVYEAPQFIEIEDPEPVMEAPVAVEEPVYEAPVEVIEEPVYEAPQFIEIEDPEPVMEAPVAVEEPVIEAPVEVPAETPAVEEPVTEAPVAKEPTPADDYEAYVYGLFAIEEPESVSEASLDSEEILFQEFMEYEEAEFREANQPEPVVEVPAVEEPVIEAPVEAAEDPVIEAPVAAEEFSETPVVDLTDSPEPIFEYTVPDVAEEPVNEAPQFIEIENPEPVIEAPVETVEEPVYEAPAEVIEEPVIEAAEPEPVFEAPVEVVEEPAIEAPVETVEEPVYEAPVEVIEEPVFTAPIVETPIQPFVPFGDPEFQEEASLPLISSGISFRFGMGLPVRSSGIRFMFGRMYR